jgi:hypothetical protein
MYYNGLLIPLKEKFHGPLVAAAPTLGNADIRYYLCLDIRPSQILSKRIFLCRGSGSGCNAVNYVVI